MRNLAVTLAKAEGVEDVELVEVAALLHDIKDWKYSGEDDAGPAAAEAFLLANGVVPDRAAAARGIIARIGFKSELAGSTAADEHPLSEAAMRVLQVVQDADRLDAIGAIGIARCLTFGGAKGRVLYDPEVKPKIGLTKDEYKSAQSTSINHFYEKLLTLKDRMKTPSGRAMADERHRYMEGFLSRFLAEWEGTM